MSRTIIVALLLGMLLGCGGGDTRAQLREACDELSDISRDAPSTDSATTLDDLKSEINSLAEESADSETDTHELALALWMAIDDGGSVGQVLLRAAGTCTQVYDEPR